jgi:hypothetical protein
VSLREVASPSCLDYLILAMIERFPNYPQEEQRIPAELDRSRFDHIGLVTADEKDGESFVESTRVWVTNPRTSPVNVEWLRFEPDSPVTGLLREQPHVAYRVDDIAAALEGHVLLAESFDPTGSGSDFLRVAFVEVDGAVVELMQYGDPDEEGWF